MYVLMCRGQRSVSSSILVFLRQDPRLPIPLAWLTSKPHGPTSLALGLQTCATMSGFITCIPQDQTLVFIPTSQTLYPRSHLPSPDLHLLVKGVDKGSWDLNHQDNSLHSLCNQTQGNCPHSAPGLCPSVWQWEFTLPGCCRSVQ
jgi:hypothetical protein